MSPRAAGLVPVIGVVFVDTLAYATAIPLIPFALLRDGSPLVAVGAVFAVFSVCQLATAPVLGRLSDRIGRRTVLAYSQIGSIVGFGLLAVSSSLPIIVVSRVIDGCSAGNIAICYAMVLDADDDRVRARGLPALGAASGAGIVCGLGASAVLAAHGLGAAALASAILSTATLSMTAMILPETRRANTVQSTLRRALSSVVVRRASLLVILAAALQAAFLLTLPAYLSEALVLGPQPTTAIIAGLVAVAAAFQVIALPSCLMALRPLVTTRAIAGLAIAGAGISCLRGAPWVVLLAAGVVVAAAAALGPVSALVLTDAGQETPVGLIMGLNAACATMGQIVGPIVGYAAFAARGTVGLGVACAALALGTMCRTRGITHVGVGGAQPTTKS